MRKAITISNYIAVSAIYNSSCFSQKGSRGLIDWLTKYSGCVLIDLPELGYWELWQLLRELPNHFHKRLIISQHHELRREFNIRGLHFSAHHPFSPDDYEGKILGTTVHGFEEVLRCGNVMNYIILHLSSAYHIHEFQHFEQAFRGKASLIPYSSLQQIS